MAGDNAIDPESNFRASNFISESTDRFPGLLYSAFDTTYITGPSASSAALSWPRYGLGKHALRGCAFLQETHQTPICLVEFLKPVKS